MSSSSLMTMPSNEGPKRGRKRGATTGAAIRAVSDRPRRQGSSASCTAVQLTSSANWVVAFSGLLSSAQGASEEPLIRITRWNSRPSGEQHISSVSTGATVNGQVRVSSA